MSINNNMKNDSINEFILEIMEKTKSFFKSFNELSKDNFDIYLECIGFLDIWNTKEEKEFLWNSFYKYNVNGKVIESSVVKGLNEILSKDDIINSKIDIDEINDNDQLDNKSIVKLSYIKKKSSSHNFAASINPSNKLNNNKDNNNLIKFIEENDIKELKQIKNIMKLLNNEITNKNDPIIKMSQVIDTFDKYPCLKVPTPHIKTYLSCISDKSSLDNNNKEKIKKDEFDINFDLFEKSIKLMDDKIKDFEKETEINEEMKSNMDDDIDINLSDIKNSSYIGGDNKNNYSLKKKLKATLSSILDNDEYCKLYIKIFKNAENSLKKCIQDMINYFKSLLTLKNNEKNFDSLNKITDNINNEDEIKINIENNIFYIQKKTKEIDLFIEETEKVLDIKDIKNKNLNIYINRIIKSIINLEEENNSLILKNKESQNNTDIQKNNIDELIKENNKLQSDKTDLISQLKKKNQDYKYIQSTLKEMDENYIIKVKEIEDKEKIISNLRQESKKYKTDYESLLNHNIAINNNKDLEYKEYENKVKLNAKNNLEKKMKIKFNEVQNEICLYNYEKLLEYSLSLTNKFNLDEKKLEEINQSLKDKNNKINQLECDLNLYREKVTQLSKENKDLRNNNKIENDNKKEFTLAELGVSRSTISINNNKNLINNDSNNKKTIIEFTLFNDTPRNSSIRDTINNGFAPPCICNIDQEEQKNLVNSEKSNKEEIKEENKLESNTSYNNSNKNDNFTNDGNTPSNNNNNIKQNKENHPIISNNEIKDKNNENNSGRKSNKLFVNETPKGDGNVDKKGNDSNKIENSIDIFKNTPNNNSERPSNPYINNNNDNDINPYMDTNDRKSNIYIINNNESSLNIGSNQFGESNPYREINQYRESNSHKESNPHNGNYNLGDLNNFNNLSQNENLNINALISQNDNSNKNIINNEYVNENDYNNSLLNKTISGYMDKSLSIDEMNEILKKKNQENKFNITSFDFLHLSSNDKIIDLLLKKEDHCALNEIFSDIIYLLDENEKMYKYIIFITKKCIYIIEPITYKIKYTYMRNILLRFTISNNNCNIIVLHFNVGNDFVIMALRRAELIYYFLKISDKDKNEVNLRFKYADEFNIKKDGRYFTQNIKSPTNSTQFNFQSAIKLGYLVKINEGFIFNQYHEKLVVLNDLGIFYFDNPTVQPKQLIPKADSEITSLESKFSDVKYAFEIRNSNRNRIVFGTDDKEEYEDWIKVFNEFMTKFKKKKEDA